MGSGGDVFSFNCRIEAAHAGYCEKREEGLDDRLENPKGNRGSDILYMFKMKAENPDKYREEAKVVVNDSAQQLLDKLTAMAAKELEERRRLEAGVTEGEHRDLGETEQSN